MKRISKNGGLYVDERGGWWIRPTLDGRRTWRRLASLTESEARVESSTMVSDHARSKLGLVRSPFSQRRDVCFREACDRYLGDGCPDRSGRLRGAEFCAGQRAILDRISPWWGSLLLEQITRATAAEYGRHRSSTPRAADIELGAVSSVLSHQVLIGRLPSNPIAGRARVQDRREVRHSRECMPASGDELHSLADRLFAVPASESLGWQLILQAMTGCRTQELLELRVSPAPRGPGWLEGRWLYVRRAKRGRWGYVEVHEDLRRAIAAHRTWLASRYPASEFWLPGAGGVLPLSRVALTHALERLSESKRTAHGLRAYYVTVHRSRGEGDAQVAARIGDQTPGLISQVYGALPEVWSGGKPLSWMPEGRSPAWARWDPPANVLRFEAVAGS